MAIKSCYCPGDDISVSCLGNGDVFYILRNSTKVTVVSYTTAALHLVLFNQPCHLKSLQVRPVFQK